MVTQYQNKKVHDFIGAVTPVREQFIYVYVEKLNGVYDKVIYISGGGANGILDRGKLEGILEQVKNDDYYPEIEDKQ